MGPTSSWAFCRQVLALIETQISNKVSVADPWATQSINLEWTPVALHEQPDVGDLPSFDYAVFLLSTVQYYIGSLYELFDHESFLQQMKRFYQNPADEARKSRFWYAQFLFVLAFGEAFQSARAEKPFPGLKYASRGLSLIPCLLPLEANSLTTVEALCLGALYLQSLDSRLMAFQLVSRKIQPSIWVECF